MSANIDYRKIHDTYPAPKGLNLNDPPYMIDNEEMACANNVYYKQGRIQTRPGYSDYCSALSGMFTGACHFESIAGKKKMELFCLSHGNISYVSGTSRKSCGLSGITIGSCNSAVMSGNGNWIGDPLVTYAEMLDISAVQQCLLVGRSTLEHNPRGRLAPVLYQTSAGGKFAPILLSANDYTGVANDPVRAKIVRNYAAHVILLQTIEGGNYYYQRVRWSDLARMGKDDWDSSNYNDLVDTKGGIVGAEILHNSLIIYKEDAIVGMTHIGGDTTFRFDLHIPDEGLMAPRAVVAIGNSHIFVGNQNIHEYFGGSNLEDIGTPIWEDFIESVNDSQADDNTPYRNRILAGYYRDMDLVAIYVPTTSDLWPKKAYIWSRKIRKWTIWTLSDNITGIGEYESDTSKGTFFLPLTGDSSGNMYFFDNSSVTDDGDTITNYFVTKQFTGNDTDDSYSYYDLLTFDAEASSTTDTVQIDYRTESDTSWTNIGAVTLDGGAATKRYQVDFYLSARRIQFRFYNSTSGSRIKIGKYTLNKTTGSEH